MWELDSHWQHNSCFALVLRPDIPSCICGYRQLPVLDRELSKRRFGLSGGKSLPYSSMTLRRTFGGLVKCMSYGSMLNGVL